MARGDTPSIFRPGAVIEYEFKDYGAGLINSVPDLNAPENAVTNGRNVEINLANKPEKRTGISLYGNFIGSTTGILGGFNFVNAAGTQEQLVVYDTGVYRYVSGTWTLLTGGTTLTTNLKADGAYFPLTNKFYITNGTNHVQVYTSGTTIAEDTSFKKGKYVIHFQNRLLTANVSSQEDYVWYTSLGVDTFGANNYFRVEGNITGLVEYYDKVLIFTKLGIKRLQNFTFNGTAAGPEAVISLPVNFGAIYDRTIQVVNGYVYFLGQDAKKKVDLYKCDGYKAVPIGDRKIRETLNSLSTAQLESACAIGDGIRYKVYAAESGQTTNNWGVIYDTARGIFHTIEERLIAGRADFACLWTSESSGKWEVYAGSQGTGQVYKLDDSIDYDELAEERYLTQGTYNVPVDANPAKRAAQSFKMSQYNSTQTVAITKTCVLMKKNAGTTTDLQVRIETDSNGKPSGTAVTNGTATLSAFSGTSYAWKTVSFSTAPELSGNTTYWLVVQHVTEGSGNSQYHWLGDTCTPTYAYGNLGTYATQTSSTVGTFNPDANPESTSVDGYAIAETAFEVDETFANVRAGTGSTSLSANDSGSNIYLSLVSSSSTDRYTGLRRAILLFDTSSIPNDATITAASISIYISEKNNPFSQSVGITSASPTANTSLTANDYLPANFGSTRFATDVNIDNFTVNAYNTFTLNSDGRNNISLTGVSKFALRLSADIDNSAPTWAGLVSSRIIFETAENTNKPRLSVTYSTPTGAATWTSDPVTDQAFQIYAQSAIDGYFDSVALLPAGFSGRYQLDRFFSMFSNTGDYKVQLGFSKGEFNAFKNFLIDLSTDSTADTWGGGGTWGSGLIWGGTQARVFTWTSVTGFIGRILKYRVRNKNANEPFTFDGLKISVRAKLRQR